MSSLSTALEGFSLATTKSTIKKHFEPPAIPRDWRPSKTPTARKSRFEPAAESPAAPTAATPVGGTNPSRDQRRAVLFPDEANRKSQAPAVESKEDVEAKEDQLPDFLTSVQTTSGGPSTTTAVAAGGSFRPFANCAEKQKRYEQYLVCLQNNRKDALKLLQPKAMTEWERERERVEFERAAVLYQPMKAVISSRFVSAGSEENGPDKSGSTGIPYLQIWVG
jgi:G patch domain-containing protein 1